ncbi:uncharacterized protein LOC120702523 [Panicum virgatum]|uniref:Uncharacterized protein n=1 Tax=Panicum virgatum TaxID=38727 RepID=A0A8T0TJY7_PANVG|nr:uncharacterized protein LOC120702523 [Panicum virgatum]KAG2609244.1 hypothetical protein PVAP13_4KG020500 [Panicum virgatum]
MTGAARRQASTAHPRIQGDLASDRDVGGGSFDLVTRMECSFFRPATSCGMGQGRNDDGDLQELNFLTVSSSLRFLQSLSPSLVGSLRTQGAYSVAPPVHDFRCSWCTPLQQLSFKHERDLIYRWVF